MEIITRCFGYIGICRGSGLLSKTATGQKNRSFELLLGLWYAPGCLQVTFSCGLHLKFRYKLSCKIYVCLNTLSISHNRSFIYLFLHFQRNSTKTGCFEIESDHSRYFGNTVLWKYRKRRITDHSKLNRNKIQSTLHN